MKPLFKRTLPLLALLSGTAITYGQAWTNWNLSFKGSTIRTIVPHTLSTKQSRIQSLITWADRSTVSTDPLGSNADGLFRPGDVVVVTPDQMLWFDRSGGTSPTTNGGGGMLRGVWQLMTDGSGNLNFARIINTHNYAPNLFAAGAAPGQQGSGAQLLGNFGEENIDNGITWAIEHETNAAIMPNTGVLISTVDTGLYSSEGGIFVQFSGQLANSPGATLPSGIDSGYDMDLRPGVEGRVAYTLTYRIPPTGRQWRQEISLSVTQNRFGPLATAVLSHNLSGHAGSKISYVSSPSLIGYPVDHGWFTTATSPYYTLSGYTLSHRDYAWMPESARPTNVTWAETPPGQGLLLAIGAPTLTYPSPFFEMRTSGSLLPGFSSSYVFQAIDNRQADNTVQRVNAMDVQLFDVSRTKTPRTFDSGQNLSLIVDYALR